MAKRQMQIDTSGHPALTAKRLVGWYDRHHRDLPWRVSPPEAKAGKFPDPYRVWLSEIMLQQTRIETVRPYFEAFTRRWPDVASLGGAPLDAVLSAWAGLGYYSRAHNLHRTAAIVAREYGGKFPDTASELRKLPGIGEYTAAAIAAIAFRRPEAAVDGNVERVIGRLHAIDMPRPRARIAVRGQVEDMVPRERPGDFAQALMDLGATICTPRRPDCGRCPLAGSCLALEQGNPERYPVKAGKREIRVRRGAAFVAIRADGAVLLCRRPEGGLLAGMTGVPTSGWTAGRDGETGLQAAPFAADWRAAGNVRHIFTHFELELAVYRADGVTEAAPDQCSWSDPDRLAGEALPALFRKVIETALGK